MTGELIAVYVAGIVTVLGALSAAIVAVIKSTHRAEQTGKTTQELVIGQAAAGQARGKVRDAKIQEIHLLVNSRLVTVLRLLVAVTKKMADQSGSQADIEAYTAALAELEKAEASARVVAAIAPKDPAEDEHKAVVAEEKLASVMERIP